MFSNSGFNNNTGFEDPSSKQQQSVPDGSWEKGEKQPSAFRDVPFAILFLVQILIVAGVVSIYGIDAVNKVLEDVGSDRDDIDYSGVGNAAGITAGVSLILSSLMLLVMIACASMLIKLSLLFSVVLSLLGAAVSVVTGPVYMALVGLLFAALSVCYACMVWSRIPFATANLVTGLTAVKANFGITFTGYLFSAAAFAWTAMWGVAFIGVYGQFPEEVGCADDGTITDAASGEERACSRVASGIDYAYIFLLLVSYYWAHQVFSNIVHVSVAGMVGTWWFVPEEASGCCSSAVTSSVSRSCTYSLGSICFGSLLVAIIQALKQMVQQARNSEDGGGVLLCLVECILNCIEDIIEYFNKWAFVYVGLYGYGYVEAGKNVMTLFQNRGWEVIIADDLVGNCLFLVSLIVGLLMGALGLALEKSNGWFEVFGDAPIPEVMAFVFGFLIGIVVSSITLGAVSSAVNATIVLFAEAPSEFAENHPSLSEQMRSAYLEAHPGCM